LYFSINFMYLAFFYNFVYRRFIQIESSNDVIWLFHYPGEAVNIIQWKSMHGGVAKRGHQKRSLVCHIHVGL
jgi:hypothetical protein